MNVAGVVDDCVPTAAAQGIELPLAITQQRLDTCDAIRGRLAAVEMRHPPAPALGFLREVRTDETRPAENQ
ncbi:MAG TPA: hypothetical protein VGG67_08655 [Steroidobacteraceae bacterium]